jgi:4-hydroxy-3-polyprenylbenzoate decarboxylase
VVVVDADCDVHDYREVAWRAFGNVDYAHDLLQSIGPVDHLDHAAYQQFWGGKVGIDATAKLPTEGYARDGGWPQMIVQDPSVVERVTRRWKELGL